MEFTRQLKQHQETDSVEEKVRQIQYIVESAYKKKAAVCLRLKVEETKENCGFVLLQLNMQNIIIELQREVEEN